jgi:hypothetical protein
MLGERPAYAVVIRVPSGKHYRVHVWHVSSTRPAPPLQKHTLSCNSSGARYWD